MRRNDSRRPSRGHGRVYENRFDSLWNGHSWRVNRLIEGHATRWATAVRKEARQVSSRLPGAQMDQITLP